jgi:lysozyme family protein
MGANFDYCMRETFEAEGGKSNHPSDKGGETNYGVIQDDIVEYNARVPESERICKTPFQLTRDEARKIIKLLYWDELLLGQITDPDMALHIFDSALLQGQGRTVKWTQKILNTLEPGVPNDIKVDGLMGSQTVFKLNNLLPMNKAVFADRLVSERKAAFNLICLLNWTQKVFINGWYNRVNSLPWIKRA